MTKLPPGFTHEMKTHIAQKPDKMIGDVPVMNFDRFCCGAHGFSALIVCEVSNPHIPFR
jgi:7,8-dihydropterin-6-yl-methyl-4-(beta-D-ribofuranosyl)aminobenzene 5'-phosphate synthase